CSFSGPARPPDLHSFPTRRSSDLLDLLRERKNPSEIIGHSRTEEAVRRIVDRIDNGFHDDDLRYSDEENFIDLRERAHRLLRFIDRKSTRLNSSHVKISYAVFCLK